MGDDERRAEYEELTRREEIDIVARTWWAHESSTDVSWRMVSEPVKNAYKARAGEVIAALDRLRDARGDDEEFQYTEEKVTPEQAKLAAEMARGGGVMRRRAARPPAEPEDNA